MSRALPHDKGDIDPEHLEIVQNDVAQQHQTHYRPVDDEEKRIDRRVNLKLDLIVVSLLAVEFIFCGIDKTNIGFVATSSFVKDANLSPDDIPNSLSLFSATYVPLQPFMVILARRVGVKYFLGLQLIAWGGLCMCHAATRGSGTLIALRLLIGAAESGFTQIGTQEEGDIGSTSVVKRDFIDVAKDWKKLLVVVCNITTVLPVTAFTTFLPLIVQGMGYSGIQATLMSVPPFVVGTVGLLVIVWLSDHFKERSMHTVGGMCIGIIGCIVMATSTNTQLRYGFAHVCMAGLFVGGPLLAVWLAGNTPWKGTRSVMMGINGWSNIAGVIAGQIFKSKYAPRYEVPLIITMVIMACGVCGLVFLKYAYKMENRKRAIEIETWDETQFAAEARSEIRRGDQRRTFMYGT
ncbi:putative transporter [Colletotrichum sp. SAR11_240]|nr:putative transporter [Colletotrichum sp. SAR11_240]